MGVSLGSRYTGTLVARCDDGITFIVDIGRVRIFADVDDLRQVVRSGRVVRFKQGEGRVVLPEVGDQVTGTLTLIEGADGVSRKMLAPWGKVTPAMEERKPSYRRCSRRVLVQMRLSA